MKNIITLLAASTLCLLPVATSAQGMQPAIWPSECLEEGVTFEHINEGPGIDQAHSELIANMGTVYSSMKAGAKAADIDKAFICALLPSHEGAMLMARVVLEYGDDPFAKELAQKILGSSDTMRMQDWLLKHH